MLKVLANLKTRLAAHSRDERGSATIEHVMWVPVIAGFMMLVTDATILMNHQSHLYELARDGARMVSVGEKTTLEAATAVKSQLKNADNYTVDLKIDGEFVVSNVSIPFKKVGLFTRTFVGDATLAGGVVMWIEGSGTPPVEAGA